MVTLNASLLHLFTGRIAGGRKGAGKRASARRAGTIARISFAALVGILVLPLLTAVGHADDRRDGRGHNDWRGHSDRRDIHRDRRGGWNGDIRRFRDHDMGRWRGGHWFNGHHGGRLGWWWIIGPTWYFYPQPVYPYPDPYLPPVVAVPAPAAQQYWYYCRNPAGYYPYVPECRVAWQLVSPQPLQ